MIVTIYCYDDLKTLLTLIMPTLPEDAKIGFCSMEYDMKAIYQKRLCEDFDGESIQGRFGKDIKIGTRMICESSYAIGQHFALFVIDGISTDTGAISGIVSKRLATK